MKHTGAKTVCGACCTECRGVTVELDGYAVLSDVSMHMHCGEMTAIIGPNGAGKTTLFRAMLRKVPYRGQILFSDAEGKRIGTPRIGYVPQHLRVEPMAPTTVLDFVGAAVSTSPAFLPPSKKKRALVRSILERTGAESVIDRRVGALSGGEAQRVMLALSLSSAPDLLLLDEPVSGVDAAGLSAFYGIVDSLRRDLDISILIISHDFSLVRRYCDRAVLLNRRVLAQGTPEHVLSGAAFAQAFPGVAGRSAGL